MEGASRKGTIASTCLDDRHFSFSLYPTGSLQVATLVVELRGSESEKGNPRAGSLRGTSWGSRSFFHQLNLCLFLQPELWGLTFLAQGPWAEGTYVGLGRLAPKMFLQNFYPPHMGEGPARVCLRASLLSEWMWFL